MEHLQYEKIYRRQLYRRRLLIVSLHQMNHLAALPLVYHMGWLGCKAAGTSRLFEQPLYAFYCLAEVSQHINTRRNSEHVFTLFFHLCCYTSSIVVASPGTWNAILGEQGILVKNLLGVKL